ncbi:MAG: adenosylmethionine decarboxylase [Dehalococcoidia bacterium]
MNALGIQIVLELKGCNRGLLDDLAYIRGAMTEAADGVGAHILGESFHQFHPQGVTGIVAIAESHLCIHTWPEYGYAAVDIFTCGSSIEPHRAAHFLIDKLQSTEPTLMELKRGDIPLSAITR